MPATAPITDDALGRGRPPVDAGDQPVGPGTRLGRWFTGAPPVLVVALLAAFAAGHFLSYPDRANDTPLFNSPHENVRYQLAERWVETGAPTYPLLRYDELPPDIAPALTPRDAALLDGVVVPKDFAYGVALVTGLRTASPWLPALITTVSAVALLLVTGVLGRKVLGSRAAGVLAGALFASTIPFWSAGSGLVETGGTTATLYLVGVVVLVERRRRAIGSGGWGGLRLDALAGLCFGLAVGTHYATVLLVAGTALAFAWRREGGSPARLGVLVATGAVTLVPVLVFNAALYGSPFTDGYSAGVAFLDDSLGENTGGLFTLRPALLGEHLWRYFLRPEALAVLGLAAIGAWSAHRDGGRTSVSVLVRAALYGGVPLLVFAGARPLSGVDSFLVNASLMRYLAPVTGVLAVVAASGAVVLGRRRPVAAVVVVGATVAAGVAVAVLGAQGPLDVLDRIPRDRAQRALALEIIPPDAVVITGRADKFLWPARVTLTAPYLVDEPPGEGDDTHLTLRAPTPGRLAEVVTGVSGAGFEVYLWNQGRWLGSDLPGAFADLDERLAKDDIERVETRLRGLWRFQAG